MNLIDLTHMFIDNMSVYPGDPSSSLKQIADIRKDGFVDHEITTAMHVGTHMDAPWHMIENGKKLSEIDPAKFFGRGVLIDARGQIEIGADFLTGQDIRERDIVLIMTGFYEKFGEVEYYENFPEITLDLAQKFVDLRVSMVGTDTPSPDRKPFKIHKLLLAKEILIIENLTNLEELLSVPKFDVIALPPKLEAEASPVRVVARI